MARQNQYIHAAQQPLGKGRSLRDMKQTARYFHTEKQAPRPDMRLGRGSLFYFILMRLMPESIQSLSKCLELHLLLLH